MSDDAPSLTGPVLVTGATGNVGGALVHRLVGDGVAVRALVRSPRRAVEILPPEVELVEGDVTVPASLSAAVADVATVVHSAGMPEQWAKDNDVFDRVNHQGTRHIADAALAAGVGTFIHVSTIDVFRWNPGVPFSERLDPEPKHTFYERSKQAADAYVTELIDKGLPARFACPAAVFGPSPALTAGANVFLRDLSAGKIPVLLPGGMPLVFNLDVAEGILRLAHAPVGTRAIFSDRYLTLRQIAQAVNRITDGAKVPRTIPRTLAHLVSRTGSALAKVTGRAPLVAAGELTFLESHAVPDATFARTELGWRPTVLEDALATTLRWIQELDET